MENVYGINEAKKAVKAGIRGYLLKDNQGKYLMDEVNRLPFYLEGSPGIGKTQMVSQIAEELGIGFISFSITHHSRNTVLGLPVIKEVNENKYTEYTMSEIIAKVLEQYEKGVKEGILLLDEFNCMSDTIMPIMLSFLQTKNIGMHTLPEGWVIVLCGNPSSYNKSAKKFDFAVLDRLRRLKIRFEVKDFQNYAKMHNFMPEIQEYFELSPQNIYVCSNEKEENLVTARAWENLDIALKMYEQMGDVQETDENMIYQFIKSEKIARDFFRFYSLRKSDDVFGMDDIKCMLEGKTKSKFATRIAKMKICGKYDVAENAIKYIHNHGISGEGDAAVVKYVSNLIAVFALVDDNPCLEKIYRMICDDKQLIGPLTKRKCPEYIELAQRIYYGKNLKTGA